MESKPRYRLLGNKSVPEVQYLQGLAAAAGYAKGSIQHSKLALRKRFSFWNASQIIGSSQNLTHAGKNPRRGFLLLLKQEETNLRACCLGSPRSYPSEDTSESSVCHCPSNLLAS